MSQTFRNRASTSAAMTLPRHVQNAIMADDPTVAVILTDPQHQIVFWNAGAAQLYGWAATEVCGRRVSAVLPIVRWVDGSCERMQAALRSQGHWSGQLIQRQRDGRPMLLAATICVVAALPPGWLLSIARPLKEPQPCAPTPADALLLGSLLSSAPFAIAFLDRQLRFLEVNEALAAISSLPSAAHPGRSLQEVVPHLSTQLLPDLLHVLTSGATIRDAEITEPVASAAHPQRHWLASYYPLHEGAGRIMGVGIVMVEISRRKRLEAQLLQAQKVATIGQLASGIAHDFTNLLTAMAGYVMLALAAIPAEASAHTDLCELQRCTERAAELTGQLLTVMRSRREVAAVIEVNQQILSMARLLGRVLGEDIVLDLRLATQDAAIRIEPGQLEQILLNLVVNVRDAMPSGGRLTIETAVVEVDGRAGTGELEVKAGPSVRLSISDSGAGMDQETQQHMFEPFFTTKALGKGSGLGLAICSGIVEQHGGTIAVQSELGRGTTVSVSFPRVSDQPDTRLHVASRALAPCGAETILVVEDDDTVRDLIARSLRAQGYTVQSAADGADALRLARACVPAQMDLLLTDVVMPGMSGPSLAAELSAVYPDIRILYISGYLDHANVRALQSDIRAAFLAKPFSVTDLGWKVREVLDGRVRPERQER